MASPTFVASYSSAYNSSASPKTVSVTTQAGDFVVVYAGSENGLNAFNTPSGNSISFTAEENIHVDQNWADAAIWSGFDATGGTNWTLSLSRTAANQFYGFTCLVFRNCSGAGASAQARASESTIGTAQASLTTTRPNSAVVVFSADWNTASANSRTWNTINGTTPTSGNGYETSFYYGSSTYIALGAYYPDVGATGANSFGYSSTDLKKYSLVALEILGTAAPIATYSFDATGSVGGTLSTGTSITDDTGNGNTLITQNGSDTIDLVAGSTSIAVEANNASYAEVQNTTAIKPTSAVSWMCWAKLTGTTYGWGQIFGRNNDDTAWGEAFSFYLDNNNNANRGFLVQVTTYPTVAPVSNQLFNASTRFPALNTWTHIAATWSQTDGTIRLFINGTQVTTMATSGYLYYGAGGNTSRYFSIFRNTQYSETANQIQIDDVRVFDVQLTAAEIATLMNTPVPSIGGGATSIPLNWVTGVNS